MTIVPRSVSTTACLFRISSRVSGVVKNCGPAGFGGAGFVPRCSARADVANTSHAAAASRRAVIGSAYYKCDDMAIVGSHFPRRSTRPFLLTSYSPVLFLFSRRVCGSGGLGLGPHDLVNQKQVGEERAQVNRRIEVVDHLRADRRLRQRQLNARLRVL